MMGSFRASHRRCLVTLAAVIGGGLAGCGGGSTTRAPIGASPPPPPPAIAPAPAAMASPPDAPAPPLDVRTPDGMADFIARLCDHARAHDVAWLEAHVRFPLVGNQLVGDDDHVDRADPLVGSRIGDSPEATDTLDLCPAPVTAAALRDVAIDHDTATAVVELRHFDHRVTFAIGGEPALIELSLVLPDVAAPRKVPKKVRRYDLRGRVLDGTDDMGPLIASFIQHELARRPACLRAQVARSTVSASLTVAITKKDNQDARVRVHASTAVPASLLGCLERQLRGAAVALFRGKAFAVHYFVMFTIPVSEDEVDPDVPTFQLGPKP